MISFGVPKCNYQWLPLPRNVTSNIWIGKTKHAIKTVHFLWMEDFLLPLITSQKIVLIYFFFKWRLFWISFQLNTERWLSDKSFISYSKFFAWKISTYFCEMKHEINFSSHLYNLIHMLSGHTFRRNYIQRRCRKAHLLINKTKRTRSQTHSYTSFDNGYVRITYNKYM